MFNQSVDGTGLPDYREQNNLAALPGNPFQERIAAMSAAVLKWRGTLPQCNDGTTACYGTTTPCTQWSYPGSLWRGAGGAGGGGARSRYGYPDDDKAGGVQWQDSEPDV